MLGLYEEGYVFMQPLSKEEKHQQVEHMFTYHAPTALQKVHYAMIGDMVRRLGHLIVDHTPLSREQSLALTHLQEVRLFANAAIALNPQKEEPSDEYTDPDPARPE